MNWLLNLADRYFGVTMAIIVFNLLASAGMFVAILLILHSKGG